MKMCPGNFHQGIFPLGDSGERFRHFRPVHSKALDMHRCKFWDAVHIPYPQLNESAAIFCWAATRFCLARPDTI